MNIFPASWSREIQVIVTISKWGNSLGLRLPRAVAADAQLAEGCAVDVRIEKGRIVIEPVRAPSLEDLLERVTAENCHGDVLPTAPVGREAL